MIRRALSNLVRRACEAFVALLPPPRIIADREGKSVYLARFYLFGKPKTVFDSDGEPKEGDTEYSLPISLMLHKFHRGDNDLALHNHPWLWSYSLILAGGYREERRVLAGGREVVATCTFLPFTGNRILANDFHRVDLLEKDCWSLFLAGPKTQSWGFWDRDTGEYTPWRQFISRRRGGPHP